MAAPERFADTPDSFPLHRGRRPYIGDGEHEVASVRSRTARVMMTLMRNGSRPSIGKPASCHARKETRAFDWDRSADHIRARSHNGCIQRPARSRRASRVAAEKADSIYWGASCRGRLIVVVGRVGTPESVSFFPRVQTILRDAAASLDRRRFKTRSGMRELVPPPAPDSRGGPRGLGPR